MEFRKSVFSHGGQISNNQSVVSSRRTNDKVPNVGMPFIGTNQRRESGVKYNVIPTSQRENMENDITPDDRQANQLLTGKKINDSSTFNMDNSHSDLFNGRVSNLGDRSTRFDTNVVRGQSREQSLFRDPNMFGAQSSRDPTLFNNLNTRDPTRVSNEKSE